MAKLQWKGVANLQGKWYPFKGSTENLQHLESMYDCQVNFPKRFLKEGEWTIPGAAVGSGEIPTAASTVIMWLMIIQSSPTKRDVRTKCHCESGRETSGGWTINQETGQMSDRGIVWDRDDYLSVCIGVQKIWLCYAIYLMERKTDPDKQHKWKTSWKIYRIADWKET